MTDPDTAERLREITPGLLVDPPSTTPRSSPARNVGRRLVADAMPDRRLVFSHCRRVVAMRAAAHAAQRRAAGAMHAALTAAAAEELDDPTAAEELAYRLLDDIDAARWRVDGWIDAALELAHDVIDALDQGGRNRLVERRARRALDEGDQ